MGCKCVHDGLCICKPPTIVHSIPRPGYIEFYCPGKYFGLNILASNFSPIGATLSWGSHVNGSYVHQHLPSIKHMKWDMCQFIPPCIIELLRDLEVLSISPSQLIHLSSILGKCPGLKKLDILNGILIEPNVSELLKALPFLEEISIRQPVSGEVLQKCFHLKHMTLSPVWRHGRELMTDALDRLIEQEVPKCVIEFDVLFEKEEALGDSHADMLDRYVRWIRRGVKLEFVRTSYESYQFDPERQQLYYDVVIPSCQTHHIILSAECPNNVFVKNILKTLYTVESLTLYEENLNTVELLAAVKHHPTLTRLDIAHAEEGDEYDEIEQRVRRNHQYSSRVLLALCRAKKGKSLVAMLPLDLIRMSAMTLFGIQ